MLPRPRSLFADVFLQDSTLPLSFFSYQLASSKRLCKLPHHTCLNHWTVQKSPTMTRWWTTGRKRNLKSNSTAQSPSWEAKRCSTNQESLTLYGTWRFITIFTMDRILNHINPSHFTIILPMAWCCKWPNLVFRLEFYMHRHLLYAWYVSHPLHPSFDCPNSVWWTAQIKKLLIMQLPSVLLLLHLSQVQTFSWTPVLKYLQSVIPSFKSVTTATNYRIMETELR